MPANDVTMGATWLELPPNEYYYEAHYAVGTPSDYDVFTVVAGIAPAGTWYYPSQDVVDALNLNYAIINTDPFVVQPHNDNLFIIYCAQGISTAEQFNAIRNNLGGTYFLLNDISLSGYPNWTPIGTSDAPFTGSLNGNGHKITGLQISRNSKVQGLFGRNDGTIEKLFVENASISVSSQSGIIAGHNYGTIRNCATSGTIQTYSYSVISCLGGIAGANVGLIDQCWSNANVQTDYISTSVINYFGGIAGQQTAEGTISNSYFCGYVAGSRSSGLVGFTQGTVRYCYTVGRVYTGGDTWARPTFGELGTPYSVKDNGNVAQQKLLSRDGYSAYTGWDTDSYTLNCTPAAEMLQSSTYLSLGWDDTNIWNIVDGQLPTLKNTPTPTLPVANPWP
jgi:hypothetical protein